MTNEQDRLAYALATLRRAAEHGYPWSIYPAEALTLVAEVERLRGERAAVVAWLYRDGCDASAERIERGEHRREEEK